MQQRLATAGGPLPPVAAAPTTVLPADGPAAGLDIGRTLNSAAEGGALETGINRQLPSAVDRPVIAGSGRIPPLPAQTFENSAFNLTLQQRASLANATSPAAGMTALTTQPSATGAGGGSMAATIAADSVTSAASSVAARNVDLRSAGPADPRMGTTTELEQTTGAASSSPLFRTDGGSVSPAAAWRAPDGFPQPGAQAGSLNGVRAAPSLTGRAGAASMHLDALGTIEVELTAPAEAEAGGITAELRAADTRRGPSTAGAATLAMDLGDPANNAERLAQQIQQSLIKGAQTLRLSLRPQALGGLELNLSQAASGELNVQIAAQSAQTRDLIDFHLPRLRASLEEAGVRLGDLSVQVGTDAGTGQQSADRQPSAGQRSAETAVNDDPRTGASGAEDAEPGSRSATPGAQDPNGIDAFA